MGPRTVGRLSLYRRVLEDLRARNVPSVFSRDLAEMAGVSPSLVRQDLMGIPYRGNPQQGYDVSCLDEAIGRKPKGHDFIIDRETKAPAVTRHMSVTGG